MNIFALDASPKLAALYHCDLHVKKMCIEYPQLLSLQHQLVAYNPALYKPTHQHHPINDWVGQSAANYTWLYQLFIRLCDQYYFRFGKRIKCQLLLEKPLKKIPDHLSRTEGLTPFYLAMPIAYHSQNPIEAYRRFYVEDKSYFATWSLPAKIPDWFNPTEEQVQQSLIRQELKRKKPFKRKFRNIYVP